MRDVQRVDHDARVVVRAHQRQRLLIAGVDGDAHAALDRGDVARAGQRGQHADRAGRVVDLERDEVAGDPPLELGGAAGRDDLAVVDDEDAVAQRVRLVEVVRREQRGGAVLAQRADVLPQVRAAVRVEAGRRLVEEHELGRVHEAERDVDAPALAARQRLDQPVAEIDEVERGAELAGALRRGGGGHAVELGLRDELLVDLRRRVRAAALRDVAELAAHADGIAPEVAARDGRLARGRHEQRRQHALRGRLAGAVGAEQPDDLAGHDVEVDAAHGLDGRAAASLERAGEPACLDHG